jgi:hypothetical protein
MMESNTICHCCGRPVEPRDPDPWEGRLDGYCEDCALNRCDAYPDQCPVPPLTDVDYKRAANDMPEKMED